MRCSQCGAELSEILAGGLKKWVKVVLRITLCLILLPTLAITGIIAISFFGDIGIRTASRIIIRALFIGTIIWIFRKRKPKKQSKIVTCPNCGKRNSWEGIK